MKKISHLNTLFKAFSLITILIISIGTVKANSGDKLVIIGGLDYNRIGQCENKNCTDFPGYLKKDLGENISLLNKDISNENIFEFTWSADPISHKEGGTNLKEKFRTYFNNNVCNVNYGNCNVSFIAHSWGTVILSDFIASLPENTGVKIKVVVTLASPVTGAQIAWNQPAFWKVAVTKVNAGNGVWVNVVNTRDVLSWAIPGTVNIQPNGENSTKSSWNQIFPVSNSEIDLNYIKTNTAFICASTLDKIPCLITLTTAGKSWLSSNMSTDDLNFDYFVNTHFPKNYQPQRLISHVACYGYGNHCDFSLGNKALGRLYGAYNKLLGKPNGGQFNCGTIFVCQSFVNKIIIANQLNTNYVWFWLNNKWNYFGEI